MHPPSFYIFIPKFSTTNFNVMTLVLCLHIPSVIGASAYPNGIRSSLRVLFEIIFPCDSPYVPFSALK